MNIRKILPAAVLIILIITTITLNVIFLIRPKLPPPSSEKEHFAIFIDGQKSGYAIHSRIWDGNTVRTSDQIHLTMERMGSPVSVGTTETSIETIKGEPIGFESVMDWSFMVTKMTGKVLGDGKVDVKSVTGQLESTKTIDWPEGALMAEGLRLMEFEKGLVKGEEFSVNVFIPSLLIAVNAKVIIGDKKEVDLLGRVVTLTEVTTKMVVPMSGEVVTTAYVDDDLNALKAVMPMMGMKIEMLACSKEFALSPNDPAEIMSKTFVKSPKPLGDLSTVKSIKYTIRPSDTTKNFNIPSNDNQSVQKLTDGTVILTVKPVKLESDKFPYKGSDKEALENLKPNRIIQSDNEMIVNLAKEAVDDTKDAAIAVKRIESFVAEYINNRSLSVGYASAVEVAQSRQGDCTEFAVLTAALCRAVGIPARVVAGVAYISDFMGFQTVFGGHAWTEAYVGGKWVGLDASFKEHGWGGYDAGHIALAAGGGRPEDFIRMVFSVGQFEIKDVEIQK